MNDLVHVQVVHLQDLHVGCPVATVFVLKLFLHALKVNHELNENAFVLPLETVAFHLHVLNAANVSLIKV